jgi:hypothetical protein
MKKKAPPPPPPPKPWWIWLVAAVVAAAGVATWRWYKQRQHAAQAPIKVGVEQHSLAATDHVLYLTLNSGAYLRMGLPAVLTPAQTAQLIGRLDKACLSTSRAAVTPQCPNYVIVTPGLDELLRSCPHKYSYIERGVRVVELSQVRVFNSENEVRFGEFEPAKAPAEIFEALWREDSCAKLDQTSTRLRVDAVYEAD